MSDRSNHEFRLIACNLDGTLAEPLSEIPEQISEACAATSHLYGALGYSPPWTGYVAAAGDIAVGGGAFVGPPASNRVEIAYFTIPAREGEGFASKTAKALVRIAQANSPGIELFAKTLPERNASTRILELLGFEHVGTAPDHEIGTAWAWLLR